MKKINIKKQNIRKQKNKERNTKKQEIKGRKIERQRTGKQNKRNKGLEKNSVNQRTFYILAYLINKTAKLIAKDIKDISDLFCEYSMSSLAQKFHGTYYANLENSIPRGEKMEQMMINKAIKKLELSDYIKIKRDKQDKEKFKISLTKKGALEYIKYKIEKEKKKPWDGKWRIIIFDILENRRRVRDLLRNRLRWYGFKELQRSAWVFPYDIKKEIEEVLEVCNVNIIGDIRFLTVEKMSNDEDLREFFGFR